MKLFAPSLALMLALGTMAPAFTIAVPSAMADEEASSGDNDSADSASYSDDEDQGMEASGGGSETCDKVSDENIPASRC